MTCENNKPVRRSLREDQRGLSTVEYALLFVLIVGGSAALWQTLGTTLSGKLGHTNGVYSGAMGQSPSQ